MTNQHPKQLARDEIDARLRIAGWAVQPRGTIDPFAFLRPSVLQDTTARSLRNRLRENLPPLDARSLHPAQVVAIQNPETSFGESHPRALIQMATGAGKTYTAATFMYRLLKFADTRRVLSSWILARSATRHVGGLSTTRRRMTIGSWASFIIWRSCSGVCCRPVATWRSKRPSGYRRC